VGQWGGRRVSGSVGRWVGNREKLTLHPPRFPFPLHAARCTLHDKSNKLYALGSKTTAPCSLPRACHQRERCYSPISPLNSAKKLCTNIRSPETSGTAARRNIRNRPSAATSKSRLLVFNS